MIPAPRPNLLLLVVVVALLAVSCAPATTPVPTSTSTPTATPTPTTTPTPTATPEVPRLRVVSSVAPITDLVRQVECDRISLTGLIPEGEDSHTYRPSEADAQPLARADLVVVNGLFLEEGIVALARATVRPGTTILHLGDRSTDPGAWLFSPSFPPAGGSPNPHLWLNVGYAMRYVELIRDTLAQVDPDNAPYYRDNARRLLDGLRELDQAITESAQTIPQESRYLLTYHDSWPYFAQRYGLGVVAALQPPDFSQPSAQSVELLLEQLGKVRLPAVFGSVEFPSDAVALIASEAGLVQATLRDDTLPGLPGAPEHTYQGMMRENAEAMFSALGGQVDTLRGVGTASVCRE